MKPYLLVAMLCLSTPSATFAEAVHVRVSPQTQVLLIAAPSSPVDQGCFQDAVNAHLSDLGATVSVKRMEDLPLDEETQRDVARALLLTNDRNLAAIWLDSPTNRLLMLIRDQNTEQLQERALDTGMQNDERRCDAAAATVRSVLTPWFTGEDAFESQPLSLQAKTNEKQKPSAAAVHVSSRMHELQAQLGAAYTLVADLKGTVLNGGALLAGLRFPSVVTVGVGIDLRVLQPSDMEISGRQISLFRLPLTLKLEAVLRSGKFGLGLAAGWTFDIARVLGADESDAPEPLDRMRMGFSPSGTIRYLAIPWLSVELSVGVDIFFEPYHYRWNGDVVLTNQAVQLFSLFGVSFLLPNKAEENRR